MRFDKIGNRYRIFAFGIFITFKKRIEKRFNSLPADFFVGFSVDGGSALFFIKFGDSMNQNSRLTPLFGNQIRFHFGQFKFRKKP